MIKVNKIIKTLENKNIDKWLIREVKTKSVEQFFVLQKLETTRSVDTTEIYVTIYKEFEENNNKYLGNYSFIINHNISIKELEQLIDEAIYASSFVKNEYYELVKTDKKKSYKDKNKPNNPFELLQDISKIFINSSNESCMFNSLELFYNESEVHLLNSEGVDYKKDVFKIMVEAIPSYKDDNFKTELYRMFTYDSINMDKIKEDSENAIKDVLLRAKAIKNNFNGKINIILKDENVRELFFELISTIDYSSVYSKSNFKSIGEDLQTNPKTKLTLSLIPSSKADYFDSDGVLLKETLVVSEGKINDYYGSNRFAYYLNMKPNGMLRKIKVKKGNKTIDKLKAKPYIEIIDLSGIQLDLYAGYIGGEVRLANYFDGKDTYPISGFSFSGNLNECINEFELSKEETNINGYTGAKYVLLKNIEIN